MTVQTILRDGAAKVADAHPVRTCAGCGERAGSISAGTGRPLVRDNASGLFFHLSCNPGAMRSGEFLERMGARLLAPASVCREPSKGSTTANIPHVWNIDEQRRRT
jgi:hypothetical protein